MLHKNVLPLPKGSVTTATVAGETVEIAVLNALSGLFCSVCDAPLSGEDRTINGTVRPYTAYTCCGVAHCPFCGAVGKQRCEHLVACRTSGDWRIAGLPNVAAQEIPDPIPVGAATLHDYSDEQKREAFGSAAGLLFDVYGPGMRCQRESVLGGRLLIDALVRSENRQHPGDGTEYYFARDVGASAESVRRGLMEGLSEGFPRLQSLPPPGAKFALNTFEVDRVVSAVSFAPCGTRFVVCDGNTAAIWRIGDGDVSLQVRWKNSEELHTYRRVLFTPDGKQVILQDQHLHFLTHYKTEFRCADTGERCFGVEQSHAERVKRLPDETDEERKAFDVTREAFLHGGATYATVRGRSVRLYDVENASGDVEPVLTLTLRLPVSHFAASPDGETFITATGTLVTVWRVPRTSLLNGEAMVR